MPDVILVNPWIYDFAAYDLWAKPLGLLNLGAKLRREGYEVALLDALDPFHPDLPRPPRRRSYGTGHYFRQPLPKPVQIADVPRKFARYGLPYAIFRQELKRLGPPRVFLVTSLMTYWYPGVFETIRLLKQTYPQVPVILGGIYATLCLDHARSIMPADYVVSGAGKEVLSLIKSLASPSGFRSPHPFPVFDLYPKLPYVVIRTSWGCPFACRYCASRLLDPHFKQKKPKDVIKEIFFWSQMFGVKDFAFYDDALLVNFESHLGVVLEGVLQKGLKVRFHTPNALHVRMINKERASLLKRAGFVTLRLGFETVDSVRHRELDGKVRAEELKEALKILREVGFQKRELGVYLLWGLPGQDFEEVLRSARFVASCGGAPYLAEYSPIPGTSLYSEAQKTSRYPLEEDPIFHNNSLFPCLKQPDWEEIYRIKQYVRMLREES